MSDCFTLPDDLCRLNFAYLFNTTKDCILGDILYFKLERDSCLWPRMGVYKQLNETFGTSCAAPWNM